MRAQNLAHAFRECRIRCNEMHAKAAAGKRLDNTRQRTIFRATEFESELNACATGQVQRSPDGDKAARFADVPDFSAKQVAGLIADAFRKSAAADSCASPSFEARLALRVVGWWLEHLSAPRTRRKTAAPHHLNRQ